MLEASLRNSRPFPGTDDIALRNLPRSHKGCQVPWPGSPSRRTKSARTDSAYGVVCLVGFVDCVGIIHGDRENQIGSECLEWDVEEKFIVEALRERESRRNRVRLA